MSSFSAAAEVNLRTETTEEGREGKFSESQRRRRTARSTHGCRKVDRREACGADSRRGVCACARLRLAPRWWGDRAPCPSMPFAEPRLRNGPHPFYSFPLWNELTAGFL